jgi:hypothetical protein
LATQMAGLANLLIGRGLAESLRLGSAFTEVASRLLGRRLLDEVFSMLSLFEFKLVAWLYLNFPNVPALLVYLLFILCDMVVPPG